MRMSILMILAESWRLYPADLFLYWHSMRYGFPVPRSYYEQVRGFEHLKGIIVEPKKFAEQPDLVAATLKKLAER
ncbi:hypothetical protein Tco_0655884 [Tanacetum coccineum]|uniref:Uncharacterized protein n=1 Tax=Tanacetum coccineum TaxID=301880 RepID=A0ABQ4X7V9_9ASTR